MSTIKQHSLHGSEPSNVPSVRTDINARFRRVKETLGLSGAEIARGSGQTRAYISRVVHDQANVGLDLLVYLARTHSISIDWLLVGTGTIMQRPMNVTPAHDAGSAEPDIVALRSEVKELRDIVMQYSARKK